MKPILYIALAGTLALGACSSTYKATHTPDDVYYSPRQEANTYASNGSNGNSRQDENTRYVQGTDDEGDYVTYQDDDQGDYQRRLNRFGRNSDYSGGYWDGYNAASNMYFNNYYGWGNPYSTLSMGWGGWGSPYYGSLWGPSLSIGFGWGMGGYYNPWFSSGYYGWAGYPYYGHYYSYYPYYGGYGHYYGGGYYTRPSNSYGPVRAGNERVIRNNNFSSGGNVINGGGGYARPSRSGVQPVNGGNTGGFVNPSSNDRPRRVFQQSGNERVITNPSYNNGGSWNSGNNGGGNYSRPQRVEYSRPAPSPSYSPAPSSGGGRVINSGGGGGGGYARPSRGGR
ncbi:MAG TPA: hypothetical protein VM802_27120 [Chitinophaga sp.]|uniref:hypothetical protein n=1 Tax=Chitinophaga sp. TaxID=1869181 RepID=UPI002C7E2B01|nr:hypothetical protein [Chitinophaga sp.]HVI48570.1 hypothetical protein [Chitinophaga sp.]